MEFKLTEEKENGLFGRKEVAGTIEADTTPSREQVLKVLAAKFSVPEENVKIKGIHGKFGSKTFDVQANIYSSVEEKDSVEIKKKKEAEAEKKMAEAAKAAAEEAAKPVEEKPAETSAEPAKEESKTEETKSEEKTE